MPVLINAPVRDGSLRGCAAERDVPTLLYEAGEALRFDEVSIRAGIRGVTSVMRKLDMLPARKAGKPAKETFVARNTSWVRATSSGILRFRAKLGQRVAEGDTLVLIGDPFGDAEEAVKSPGPGIIIGKTNLPLAHEGDALIHIARFQSIAQAEGRVEEFQAELDPEQPNT